MIVTYYVRILMEASSVPALRDSSFILTRNNVTVSPFYFFCTLILLFGHRTNAKISPWVTLLCFFCVYIKRGKNIQNNPGKKL